MAPLQAKRGTDCPRRGVRLGGMTRRSARDDDDGYWDLPSVPQLDCRVDKLLTVCNGPANFVAVT